MRVFVVLSMIPVLWVVSLDAVEEKALHVTPEHTINFHDVPVVEFVKYVSKISGVNFVFNNQDLSFTISLSSGASMTSEQVVKALVHALKTHGLQVLSEDGYLVIHKSTKDELGLSTMLTTSKNFDEPKKEETQGGMVSEEVFETVPFEGSDNPLFFVYKLQYHEGKELEETIHRIAADLKPKHNTPPKYLEALQSIQWIKSTNSLLFSGEETALDAVKGLIESLDVPLRQVFIEILVIETDIKNGSDFGIQWGLGGKVQNSLGFGSGSFNPGGKNSPFALSFQNVDSAHPPTGPNQFSLGSGFDVGVIGDVIFHKGASFISLGSLVSALQTEGDSTIVLNQKLITQDNKNSKIFVGDNIPFTGSVVSTVGQSQQTTANIEYRDIGVTLNITPKLGEGNVITLDLSQKLPETVPSMNLSMSNSQVGGIQTTKTEMMTHVHVPDQHFLVLSGMIRNSKTFQRSGVPCLGTVPWLGSLFSKSLDQSEKRNVIVFVRPHIIRSVDDYDHVTERQERLHNSGSHSAEFLKHTETTPNT